MSVKCDRLYVVVPCYNEEEVLPETTRRLGEKLRALISGGRIAPDSRVMLVDDGSRDRTWELIEQAGQADPLFCGVKLSRNRGHQNALLAGLMTARERADMVISMDADLQDDIEAVDRFLDEYYAGHDIVYGVRGAPIVNDALLEDAVRVGMDGIARVMDNGDDSQGTVLERVSGEFYRAYKAADVVIAKGQANFESLMEAGENIYFLMLVKCATMADISHAPERGMVCMKRR